jgi:hypothetical protein
MYVCIYLYTGAQKLTKGDVIKETERILENDRKEAQGVRCVLMQMYLYILYIYMCIHIYIYIFILMHISLLCICKEVIVFLVP